MNEEQTLSTGTSTRMEHCRRRQQDAAAEPKPTEGTSSYSRIIAATHTPKLSREAALRTVRRALHARVDMGNATERERATQADTMVTALRLDNEHEWMRSLPLEAP